MKFFTRVSIVYWALVGLACSEISNKERREAIDGLRFWQDFSDEAKKNPTEDNIEKLSRGIRKLNRDSIFTVEERSEVEREVVRAFLSIPEVVERYESKLNKAKREWNRSDKYDWRNQKKYREECGEVTSLLYYLPDVRAVRILGDLLPDVELVGSRQDIESLEQFLNGLWAMRGLKNLIEDGPEDSKIEPFGEHTDRYSWINWYEQVKAGTRTFRFKGDPQPYTLDGPAEKELHPPLKPGSLPEPRLPAAERMAQVPAEVVESETESRRRTPWIAVLFSLSVLAAGGICAFRLKGASR